MIHGKIFDWRTGDGMFSVVYFLFLFLVSATILTLWTDRYSASFSMNKDKGHW